MAYSTRGQNVPNRSHCANQLQTLLGMNYVHIVQTNPFKLQADREFFVFVVLTIFLLTVTLAAWAIFECCQRGRQAGNAGSNNEKPPV
jgi:ribose/xylose/arabinose/galactoside ABC-type transport system permease subunit